MTFPVGPLLDSLDGSTRMPFPPFTSTFASAARAADGVAVARDLDIGAGRSAGSSPRATPNQLPVIVS